MRKKILLLGSIKSIYITQFIENVLLPLNFDIYLFSEIDESKEAISFVNKNNIHFIEKFVFSKKMFCPYFGKFIFFFQRIIKIAVNVKRIRKQGCFDYINLHFVTNEDLLLINFISNSNVKKVATYWGSDFFRASKLSLFFKRFLLRNFDVITTDSLSIYNLIYDKWPYNRIKTEVIYFGVSLFNYIDKINSVEKCKAFFSIDKSKVAVAIGYNAKKEQQHEQVIKALSNIENKNQYVFILQLTYGKDRDYLSHLNKIISESGLNVITIDEFLSYEKLAMLRVATDIFINAQTTDAFCNSIKEYFYTKTRIISAIWLHYPEIDLYNFTIKEFSDFSEIPFLLSSKIDDNALDFNKNNIKNISSWDSCKKSWSEIFFD
ncbi:MAG: glycosyltransferase family 4 protein [Pseudobutyrivibrio ruminis]|nr:glycosyltransferase family 4 protein [Pseudobutyrivibrio ruminis]